MNAIVSPPPCFEFTAKYKRRKEEHNDGKAVREHNCFSVAILEDKQRAGVRG